MPHSTRNDEALTRSKIDNAIFKIDQKMAIEHKEEFINVAMRVPVIFTLQNAQPNDCVIYFAERLVVPLVRAGIG
jgi:hypothetical protein